MRYGKRFAADVYRSYDKRSFGRIDKGTHSGLRGVQGSAGADETACKNGNGRGGKGF